MEFGTVPSNVNDNFPYLPTNAGCFYCYFLYCKLQLSHISFQDSNFQKNTKKISAFLIAVV